VNIAKNLSVGERIENQVELAKLRYSYKGFLSYSTSLEGWGEGFTFILS